MEALRSYFNEIIHISEHDWQAIKALAKEQQLKKEEILLVEGERADHEVFILQGVVRAYRVDEEGNEKSTAFFQDGAFMSLSTMRSKNGLSTYNYQALCNTKVVLFPAKPIKDLLSATKQLTTLGKNIKDTEMSRLSERDECLLQVKATDKYRKFLLSYPKLEQVIAQRHIASYLGITAVSLSRLKKELAIAEGVIN